MMTAKNLVSGLSVADLLVDIPSSAIGSECRVTGISLDSREVQPGDLFMAVKGSLNNGLDFIDDAVSRGAACVLCEADGEQKQLEAKTVSVKGSTVPLVLVPDLGQKQGIVASRFYGHPSRRLKVIGVTGTNGKTSVTHYLAQILAQESPCGVIGTLGYGLWGKTREGINTTPSAVTIQGLLHDFVEQAAEYAVMEVSSHGLDQGRLHGTHVDIAVFTNLTHDHLDYHGDMQAYGRAKKLLFETDSLTHAVINVDDEFGRQLSEGLRSQIKRVGYSLDADNPMADVYCRNIILNAEGAQFELVTPWGECPVTVPLLGNFNLSNLLATVSALHCAGFEFEQIRSGLDVVRAVPGRMEKFTHPHGPMVVVDYAHTPDALRQLLVSLRAHAGGKLFCVFGCGGDRDQVKRPIMGSIAEALADQVILTDDNPRTESPAAIIKDILSGMSSPAAVTVMHDRGNALTKALASAGPGDIVAIAGKGHEEYQLKGNSSLPFSDRALVSNLLSSMYAERK